MALAQQHDVAVLQQRDALGVAHPGQEAEGEVDAAAVERGRDLGGLQGQGLEAHARRQFAEPDHQCRQEAALADVAHVDAEGLARRTGLEALGLVERLLQCAQRRLNGQRQPLGTRRGRDTARRADEQRILQQQPQPAEAMARRRLGEAEGIGGAAHAARAVDGVEEPEQVQVNLIDMHAMHIT
jgi:hypothetical protein